jgi:hypothetical protein
MAVVPSCTHGIQGLFCGSLPDHQTPGSRRGTRLLMWAELVDNKFSVIQLGYADRLLSTKGFAIKHGLSIRQNDNQLKTGPGLKYSHLSSSRYIMFDELNKCNQGLPYLETGISIPWFS